MMARHPAGSVADQDMLAEGRLQLGAQRDAGKREVDHFASDLISGRAREMRDASRAGFDAVVAPEIGAVQEMTVHFQHQLIGQFFPLLHRAGESHDEAAALCPHDRAFKASQRVEIDDGAAFGLFPQLAKEAGISRRNILDGADGLFLGGRNVKAAGDGNMNAAKAAALFQGARDDFLASFPGSAFIGRGHERKGPGTDFGRQT